MVGRTVGLKGWDLMGHFMELEAQKVSLGKIVLKWFTHLIESPMQKKLLKLLYLASWLLITPAAQAQQADCGFIQNPDRQAYCRAISGGGSSHCGFIREPDLQARCRAETGGGSSQCGFIRDRDMQAACRASADRANSSNTSIA